MGKVLSQSFFDRSVLDVAPELLGKYLVRKDQSGNAVTLRITEVEAYDGQEDLACHASKGRTPRTSVMFGRPGVWYVYLIYGMYDMLNIVTGPGEHPSAVLIRGVSGLDGPGKLTKALGITRAYNAKAATRANGLWIEDRAEIVEKENIVQTARIGVAYAGVYAHKPWRFVLKE